MRETSLLTLLVLPLVVSGLYTDLRGSALGVIRQRHDNSTGSDTEQCDSCNLQVKLLGERKLRLNAYANRYSEDEPAATLTLRLITPDNEHVQLTLERSSSVPGNPTTVIRRNGKKTYWKAPEGRSLVVYSNAEQYASVVVERRKDRSGNVVKRYRGSFRHNDKIYSLHPVNKNRESARHKGNTKSSTENRIGGIDHMVSRVSTDGWHQRDLSTPLTSNVRHFFAGDKMASHTRRYQHKDDKVRYVVELLILVDFALYKSWYADSQAETAHDKHDEAIAMITHYYSEVCSGIDMRYATIREPDFGIRVRLVGFFIATTALDSPWTEDPSVKVIYQDEGYTNMYKGLEKIGEWAVEATATFTPFDHAVLFTGNYLFDGTYGDNGRPNTKSGLAHMEGVCDKKRKVSINYENGQYSSIQTGAHELAHNLGSKHDAENNECKGEDQYVMSAAPGALDDTNFKNTFNFSQCSIGYLRTFLAKLTNANINCLLVNEAEPLVIDHVYPGLVYTADAQCQFFMAMKESFFCGGGNLEKKMCKQILCWDPDQEQCVTSSEWRSYVGTTCGNRKWCMKGQCTENMNAPVNNDTCVYGDYRVPLHIDHDIPLMTCAEAAIQHPWKCYDSYHADHCCVSCVKAAQTEHTGCEFGDRNPKYCGSAKRGDCYDSNFEHTCCDFCKKQQEPSAGSDCLYGDKASWCSESIQSPAWQCYEQAESCCETCHKHKTGPSGCEYGDKAIWCSQMELDAKSCKPSDLGDQCCGSCAKLFPDGIPEDVPGAPPAGGSANCPQGDVADYCSTITSSQCYEAESVCCLTCEKLHTGSADCKYGDKVPWCDGYVDAQECSNPQSVDMCCHTCKQFTG